MGKRYLTVILTFSLLLFSLPILSTTTKSAPPTIPPASKISPALMASIVTPNSSLLSPVIILTNGAPSLLLKLLITSLGGIITREFTLITGLAALVPLGSILQIASCLGVVSVTPDRLMTPLMDVTLPTVGATTAQQSYGLDGGGVGVAIIDS